MRKLLILLVLFIAVGIVNAQKPYVTNQYVYDLFQMNPAAAAYQKNCVSVNGFYQKQWFGTDLAPTTQIVSFQMPLESRLGSGTYVYNDRNGVIKELGLSQAFSYELLLHKNRRRFSTLTFGLAFLVEQSSIDQTGFQGSSIYDPIISGGVESGVGFNASSGILFKINNTHAGISATNIIPQNNPLYSSVNEPNNAMDFHVHLGGAYHVPGRDLILEPLVRYRRNVLTDSRLDLNMKLYMPTPNPDFATWGLLAYRHVTDENVGKANGFAVTAGIVYTNFSVGLEYQLGLTTAQVNYGSSYQLIVGYRICKDKSKGAIPCSKIRQNRRYNYNFVGY